MKPARMAQFAILLIVVVISTLAFLIVMGNETEMEKAAVQSSPSTQAPPTNPVFTSTVTAQAATLMPAPTPTPTAMGSLASSPTPLPILFPHTKACEDGADNDNDGFFDLADPQCRNEKDNDESK